MTVASQALPADHDRSVAIGPNRMREIATGWQQLQRTLGATLAEAIPEGSRIVYLDYPVHKNVGDLLIYLGTHYWINSANLQVMARHSLHTFDCPPLADDIILVCHGGGNFGDLYPEHQSFREVMFETYRRNRIVILPQTVHFRSPEALAVTASKLNSHSDAHIFCRCAQSLATAQPQLTACHLRLAPDMATFLYPLQSTLGLPRGTPNRPELRLIRTDVEASAQQMAWLTADRAETADWNEMIGLPLRLLSGVYLRLDRHFPRHHSASLFEPIWRSIAEAMIRRSAGQMARYRQVTTSRLHGHILATLLGIPNNVIDNSYGKNSSYIQTWHRPFVEQGLVRLSQA